MGESKLVNIFHDVYSYVLSTNGKNYQKILKIDDNELFENNLWLYLKKVMGNKIVYDYEIYYREIRKYFENLIVNASEKDLLDINNFIIKYTNSFFEKIDMYPLASNFITTARLLYSSDLSHSVIGHNGMSYTIMKPEKKEEEAMPSICINNISEFENILVKFVNEVKNSDSYFNSFFNNMNENAAISYLFEWVTKNANYADLANIEKYFVKYTSFITDKTFDNLKSPVKIGRLLGDDLYVMRKRANVNYETPYYLSFMMNSEVGGVELPTIRLGIEDKGNEKIAHFIATQTSQEHGYYEHYESLNECFKKMFDKSKYFREFNPAHIISIILSLGLLKGVGIDKVEVVDYLPLRLQRLILEERKNTEELESLQYRLTNKNLYNYLRLCEHFDGIEIMDYPETNGNLSLHISDEVSCKNDFFQNLYNIGYQAGVDNRVETMDRNSIKR